MGTGMEEGGGKEGGEPQKEAGRGTTRRCRWDGWVGDTGGGEEMQEERRVW